MSAKNCGIHLAVKGVESQVMEEYMGKLTGDQNTTKFSSFFL